MEHLPFASTFWVLQVIVSLRCKFQGVYTQEQLIGSKKGAGIIQACLPILLTTPVTLHQVSTFFTGTVISSLSIF
ncbi:unnamed protein product [Sphagnum tenellum]